MIEAIVSLELKSFSGSNGSEVSLGHRVSRMLETELVMLPGNTLEQAALVTFLMWLKDICETGPGMRGHREKHSLGEEKMYCLDRTRHRKKSAAVVDRKLKPDQ